jgi:hypothetical protein
MLTKFTIAAGLSFILSGCAMLAPTTESRYVSDDGQLHATTCLVAVGGERVRLAL